MLYSGFMLVARMFFFPKVSIEVEMRLVVGSMYWRWLRFFVPNFEYIHCPVCFYSFELVQRISGAFYSFSLALISSTALI
jgi:hypothetical protein